jgi:hypothetical protein
MKRVRLILLAAMSGLLALGIFVPMAGAQAVPRAGDLTAVSGAVIGFGGVGRSYWEVQIANAGIYMHDATLAENPKVATSDSMGFYAFSVNLKLQPEKKADFYVSPIHYDRVDITIHNNPQSPINEIFKCQVLPTVLTGKVTNKLTGKPVKNVKVQVLNWDVKTNAQGVYLFTPITDPLTLQPNMDYKAWFSKAGFKRTSATFKSLPTDKGLPRTLNLKIAPSK